MMTSDLVLPLRARRLLDSMHDDAKTAFIEDRQRISDEIRQAREVEDLETQAELFVRKTSVEADMLLLSAIKELGLCCMGVMESVRRHDHDIDDIAIGIWRLDEKAIEVRDRLMKTSALASMRQRLSFDLEEKKKKVSDFNEGSLR
jgi:hypothetical protein